MLARVTFALVTAAVAIAGFTTLASSQPLTKAPNCPVFPTDNRWNQRVDALPAATNSNTIVNSIGRSDYLHPDFGSGKYNGGPIGIPFRTVSGKQKKVPVTFDYGDESDPGPYPIPPSVPIEGGNKSDGDRHAIVVDRDNCKLYELYDAHKGKGGRSWQAGSGAIFDLRSNDLRPETWTSADAAGLPILPGLIRYEEFKKGEIDHAIRFTVERTRRAYVYPARHYASSDSDPDLPPMGMQMRLKASVDISGYPAQSRVVLRALQRYGMILADNGSNWYISGAPSSGWRNDDLHRLQQITGDDFEVVDTSSLPTPGL
jgi:hypothetical protein